MPRIIDQIGTICLESSCCSTGDKPGTGERIESANGKATGVEGNAVRLVNLSADSAKMCLGNIRGKRDSCDCFDLFPEVVGLRRLKFFDREAPFPEYIREIIPPARNRYHKPKP